MKIDIFGDNISYVTDEVSIVSTELANLNEENRIKFVTDLAAISRGKSESANPAKRYQQLLKEAALGTASRPLEFLPVILRGVIDYANIKYTFKTHEQHEEKTVDKLAANIVLFGNRKPIKVSLDLFMNTLGRFSYIQPAFNNVTTKINKEETVATDYNIINIYTNVRAIINTPYFDYEDIPYMSNDNMVLYKQFKAIKLKIPMYIWSQWPMTHTMLSKESQSDRVATQYDYWLPKDLEKRANETLKRIRNTAEGSAFDIAFIADQIDKFNSGYYNDKFKTFNEFFKFIMLYNSSQEEVQEFLNECGYKQEIYSRAPYYFKYKEVVVTGWYNDSCTWKHSFIERNCELELWKNWTQKETQQVLKCVKEIIEKE